MWIPYDKFVTETEVYLLEVVKRVPRLEFKIALQTYSKTDGRFTSGFAPDAASWHTLPSHMSKGIKIVSFERNGVMQAVRMNAVEE